MPRVFTLCLLAVQRGWSGDGRLVLGPPRRAHPQSAGFLQLAMWMQSPSYRKRCTLACALICSPESTANIIFVNVFFSSDFTALAPSDTVMSDAI